jgi:hypothetical protein
MHTVGSDPHLGIRRVVPSLETIRLRELIRLDYDGLPLGVSHCPVILYLDSNGYEYDETSEWWKGLGR